MYILYKQNDMSRLKGFDEGVRWLRAEDSSLISAYIEECNRSDKTDYTDYLTDDNLISYCGLFSGGRLRAVACVERYSSQFWEAADVRTLPDSRNKGFGCAVVCFITRHILQHGRTATCHTHVENIPMRKILSKLGFEERMRLDDINDHYSGFITGT